MKIGMVSIGTALSYGNRIAPSLHLVKGITVREELKKLPYALTTIASTAERIFIGNIFARNWVADKYHGVTYLAASDSVLANLEVGRYISKKQATELSYLRVKSKWILATCSGTLGKLAFTNSTFEDKLLNLVRIVPSDRVVKRGVVYAYLRSKYGYYQLAQSRFGGVVKHVNATQVGDITIPIFPQKFQEEINELILSAVTLCEESAHLLSSAETLLKQKACLRELTPEDYDYFGQHSADRKESCFTRNIKEVGTITINAFNNSERIRNLKDSIPCATRQLKELLQNGRAFSTGSFPRIEVNEGCGIMLINQSDIFDTIITGKYISKCRVKTSNLVEYGEVLIAGVGTLGESETFCRAIFANEDLQGQLVSGEFIRMKTTEDMPSMALFAWLNTDYGFRLIRNTQAGTKLCRPIPRLFIEIPVPIKYSNQCWK